MRLRWNASTHCASLDTRQQKPAKQIFMCVFCEFKTNNCMSVLNKYVCVCVWLLLLFFFVCSRSFHSVLKFSSFLNWNICYSVFCAIICARYTYFTRSLYAFFSVVSIPMEWPSMKKLHVNKSYCITRKIIGFWPLVQFIFFSFICNTASFKCREIKCS